MKAVQIFGGIVGLAGVMNNQPFVALIGIIIIVIAIVVQDIADSGFKHYRKQFTDIEEPSISQTQAESRMTDANPSTPGGREIDREYVMEVFGKAYRKLEQSPEPSKGELITIDAAIEAYTDITLMPLIAAARLSGARVLASKVKGRLYKAVEPRISRGWAVKQVSDVLKDLEANHG